jgi:uncharacterized membrane protein
MNIKIKERLDSWDLRSMLWTIFIISITLFLIFYFTGIRDRFRADDKEKFEGQIKGEIVSVESIEKISHSKSKGTLIYTDGYNVSYQYSVNGQAFNSIDFIPLTTKNQKLLTTILERKSNACFVKFDVQDPTKSILIESN